MKLFTPTTPRPRLNDSHIIKATAMRLLPDVLKWTIAGGGTDTEEERDLIVEDLVNVLKWHYNDDGYAIAKELDHKGWCADSELVQILDNTSMIVSSELTKVTTEWVKQQAAVTIPLDIKVVDTAHRERGVGILYHHYSDGKSAVRYEHLGHVKEGPGTHGHIINWENLETVE